ncbi:hypothetical protein KUCAC02_025699 [Chaenocephalus aceratus]|uniref:Uncharacterized protein n=1 Tax=Chaenocephalus aceratus TaxID=36190 RepID=A0ACB9VVB1_CHAAC|nr:hypothetical protein KUCAC02_025699 [Chaenocephalus aceratus]
MTMGLGALEEIVTGNRTRQRLPYAEVNSPNHPPGTWSPDSRGEAAGTEEPQPRLINHDCDVSLLLVPPCCNNAVNTLQSPLKHLPMVNITSGSSTLRKWTTERVKQRNPLPVCWSGNGPRGDIKRIPRVGPITGR